MRRLPTIVVVMLLCGTAAAQGPQSRLTTRPVHAVLEARRVATEGERFCLGGDGLYRFALETYEGTSTGDDDVSGRFVLQVHAFDNVTQGFRGPAPGSVKVYDLLSGRLKVAADMFAVDWPSLDPPGVRVDGFVKGQIISEPGPVPTGGGHKLLFANFSVLLDATASFVGNLGGDAPVPPRNTALVVNMGHCAPIGPTR